MKKGFTLIEMLVVIAIIGILAAGIVVGIGPARARARDAKRVANILALKDAVELFKESNGLYPSSPLGSTGAELAINVSAASLPPCSPGPYCAVPGSLTFVGQMSQYLTIPNDPRGASSDKNYLYVARQNRTGYGFRVTWDNGDWCLTGENMNLTDDLDSPGIGWWGKGKTPTSYDHYAGVCQL